jgi:mRNA interferase YafQ
MLRPRATAQFKRDRKRCRRRGFDLARLDHVMELLACGDLLGPEYRPHPLHGEFEDCWECHLGFDWLLIWRVEGQDLVFVRTGTHADLFE